MEKFFTRVFYIKTWSYFFFFTIYFVVSGVLFTVTTGGYSMLGSAILSFFGYGILALVLFTGTIILRMRKVMELEIYRNVIWFATIPSQIILLFLTTRDCGDSPCKQGYDPNFLRSFLFPDISPIHTYAIYDFRIVFWVVYILSLCVVVLSPLFGKSKGK